MTKIAITTSIYCHIALEFEQGGRFGVQGNTFKNTFGYMNQYFQTCRPLPEKLKKLSAAMETLVSREDDILRLNRSDITTPSLNDVTARFTQEIMHLTPDRDFLLPGGWSNDDE